MKWCPYIKKKIKGVIHIFDPVFCCNYWVVLCPAEKEFVRIMKKQGIDVGDLCHNRKGRFLGLVNDVDNVKEPVALIWSSDKRYCLIHEVLHAITWHLESKGIKHTDNNSEVYCYMQQFILRSILEE